MMKKYKSVTVFADVMYVKKMSFFTSIARDLKFGKWKIVVNKKVKTLLDTIRITSRAYKRQGFTAHTLFKDNEFVPLEGELSDMGIILNTVTKDGHILEIESFCHTVK